MNPMVLLLIFALCILGILGAYTYIFVIHNKFLRELKMILDRLTKFQNDLEQIELHMKVINKHIDHLKR